MASTVIPLRQSSLEASLKQAAFDQLAVPVVCVNASAQLLLMNVAATTLLEATDSWIGRPLTELLNYPTPQHAMRRWTRFWSRLAQHKQLSALTRLPLEAQHQVAVRLDAQWAYLGQDPVAVVALFPLHEQRLQSRRDRVYRAKWTALTAMRAGLSALIDAEQKIIWISPGVREFAGVNADELRGLPFDYLLDEASATDFNKMCAAVRADQSGNVFQATWRMRGRSGLAARWLSCRLQSHLHHPSLRAVLIDAVAMEATPGAASMRKLMYRDSLLDLALQTSAVQATTDFAKALARVLRVTGETLESSQVGYWRSARQASELRCEMMFERAANRFVPGTAAQTFDLRQSEQWSAFWADQKTLAIPNAEHHALAPWLPRNTGSALLAPILLDAKAQGALIVMDAHPREWSLEDVDFIDTVARVLALSLQGVQRQQAESRVEQLAWYDALTGLPNRNLLRESMRSKLVAAANRRRRIAVMLMDLDRFKDVNDTLGHLVGDALIKSVAQVLLDTVGEAGTVARLGGDEFVILIDQFEHRQEVSLLAARLVQALNRTDLVSNVDTQASASIGIALFPEHGKDISTLLKNADAAMYQAKRDGRNQFSFFNPTRFERAVREVQLGIQLHKALQSGPTQFYVEYQPQVELSTGRVVGLESLIRWQHPTFGRLTPDAFIDVAEVSGLSEKISRWMVNEVCAQIGRWRTVVPGFDIPVAINVAGRELGSAALPLLVRAALLRHGIEPHMVALEITERTLVQDNAANNDVMLELAALGVSMILDDFGTGFSMLGYLKRMPIHALKIDQSFIKDLPQDGDSGAIVEAVLAVACHFKLKVIAEGVEKQDQVDYLRSLGCGYAQGHLYSRPLQPQDVTDLIAKPKSAD